MKLEQPVLTGQKVIVKAAQIVILCNQDQVPVVPIDQINPLQIRIQIIVIFDLMLVIHVSVQVQDLIHDCHANINMQL